MKDACLIITQRYDAYDVFLFTVNHTMHFFPEPSLFYIPIAEFVNRSYE